MAKRKLRIPMFFKFFAGCLLLAVLLIGAGTAILHHESQMKSRGDYLAKHFKRYQNYQAGLGRAVTSVAGLLAHDDRLIRGLSAGSAPAAAGESAPPPPSRVAAEMFKLLSSDGSIQPDLFVVFDRRGLVWANKRSVIGADDLSKLEVVRRVRDGQELVNEVLIHKGRAVQLGGVPIRPEGGGDPIGGLLIGVNVERYMEQYKQQSDERKIMQHRLTLVDREGNVVASVFPKEMWPQLAKALKKENWDHRREGDFMQKVAVLPQGDFDLHVGDVAGFEGQDRDKAIGKLYLLRSRSNLKGRGAKIPWLEIFAGILLSLIIASLLAMWITKPIKKFVTQSRAMLSGGADLNQRIEIQARDETADLAENINNVFSRLYGLAAEVQGAAFQVGASSAQISAASKQMLSGLKDQTMKIESSTAAVTELSASIQQVASNAGEATQVAEKSNVAVTSAVQRMQQIRSAVEEAADKMQELGESSKRIGNIVEVIHQISEQTSLLALNASIEAAHAGEQGRGFAVVADEVSSLARRVGQSAKDIEGLIQTIKEQTTEAVTSMETGTREVEQGTGLVTNTLTDLQQLIHVVKDTAAAVQEQAEVSDEIARNMDAVQKIAAEMVTGSEEAVVQGEQLHALAFELEESVGGFNIESSAPPSEPPAQPGGGNSHPPGSDGGSPRALKGSSAPRA